MAEGLIEYEAGLNEVGIPRWLAEDQTRQFMIDEKLDCAMAALESQREAFQKGEATTHGVRLVVVDMTKPDA